MSEAVIAHWEVTRAKNAGQKPNPHGGQFDKFYVGLRNLDGGTDCEDAYWQRKAPSEVTVGDKVYGKIEEGDYGFRFYLEKDEEGNSRPPGGSTESKTSNNSKASSGGETNWTERNAEIRRQHSQQVAIEFAALSDESAETTLNGLTKLIDWFDQDAIAAGQRASQGAAQTGDSPHSSSLPAAPDSPSADMDFSGARTEEPGHTSLNFPKSDLPDVDRDHIMRLLSSAGLVFAGAQEKVADYILTQLVVAGREKAALSGLQDHERQGVVLAQLKVETEKWIGSPLPQGDALDGDESIPF
jgi:hypothetical protein